MIIRTYNTTVDVSVSHEGSPVFKVLRLVGREGHLSDVCNHVFVGEIVINELRFVMSVEDIEQLGSLPDGVCSQDEVLLILPPVDVAD